MKLSTRENYETLFDLFREGKLEEFAKCHIQSQVNWELQGEMPSIWFGWYEGEAKLDLHWKPATLLTGLWLQFGVAIAGNKQFRACDNCGQWSEV